MTQREKKTKLKNSRRSSPACSNTTNICEVIILIWNHVWTWIKTCRYIYSAVRWINWGIWGVSAVGLGGSLVLLFSDNSVQPACSNTDRAPPINTIIKVEFTAQEMWWNEPNEWVNLIYEDELFCFWHLSQCCPFSFVFFSCQEQLHT